MSDWQQVRLGNVAQVVPGFAFKSKDWRDTGMPVLKIKNIRGDGYIDIENVDCVPTELITPRLKKFEVVKGDILLAMTGATAGKVGKLRSSVRFMLNQRVAKLLPIEIDPAFFGRLSAVKNIKIVFLSSQMARPNRT